MQQFNLDTWLKDKSRKVVTRRGNPVRIICWDRKHGEDDLPIVFLEECNGGEFLLTCKSNGRDGSSKDYDTPYDLFFADEGKLNSIIDELKSYLEKTPKEQVEKDWKEIQDWYTQHFINENHNKEEELTEFEKELEMMMVSFSNGNLGSDVRKEMPKQKLRNYARRLLDLAKNEFKKKFVLLAKEDYQTAFDLGKTELMKELPKWKKCDDNLPYSHIGGLNNRYLIKDGYCIKISDLETLPKEE